MDVIREPHAIKLSIKPEAEPLSWKFWRKRRYIVVLMAFLGFVANYSLRVNLSIALLVMTENRTVHYDNGTIGYAQHFNWSSTETGLILSAFFWGYICTEFIGGLVAKKVGGNWVFGFGTGSTAIITVITPWIGTTVTKMIILRFLIGICSGVTFSCIHEVWANWSPPPERSRMATITYAGTYVGTVITMPACGYFANFLGWQSSFYIFGASGIVWYIVWTIIVKRAPRYDRFISKDELEYIESSLTVVIKSTPNVPWMSLFTSKAVYAIAAAHTAENWGFYTMITQMPKFLHEILHYDSQVSAILSAIPYLVMGIFISFAGSIADLLQVKGILTTTQVRRYFNCGAFAVQAFFMILAASVLHAVWTPIFIIIGVGVGALAWCGFAVNPLDIAPQYASVIMGFSNTFGTVPGIVSPTLTGYLVQNQNANGWRIVFSIIAVIYILGCTIYWFWCTGKLQEWAKLEKSKEEDNMVENENTPETTKVAEA